MPVNFEEQVQKFSDDFKLGLKIPKLLNNKKSSGK